MELPGPPIYKDYYTTISPASRMKSIDIILPPDRKDTPEGDIKLSYPNCATATLLQTEDGKRILFDTGAFGYADKLVKGLKTRNLRPEDINYVILSHAHFDHNANAYLFKNAQLIQDKWLIDIATGKTRKFGKEYHETPHIGVNGLKIIHTPGHTEDSISVLAECHGNTYAIVGDAIKASLIKKGNIPGSYSNPEQYLENMKMLFSIADIIITGEDGIIEGTHFKDIKELLRTVTTGD